HGQAHPGDDRRGVRPRPGAGRSSPARLSHRADGRRACRGPRVPWVHMGRHFRMYGAPVREEDQRPITRTTIRRVVAIFRPYRWLVGLVGIAIVVSSALGVVNPLMIRRIFDDALFGVNTGGATTTCQGQPCPNLDALWTYV